MPTAVAADGDTGTQPAGPALMHAGLGGPRVDSLPPEASWLDHDW